MTHKRSYNALLERSSRTPNNNSHTPKPSAKSRKRTAAVVAAVSACADAPPPKTACTAEEITKSDLMAKLHEVAKQSGEGLPANESHKEQALKTAKRYGVEAMQAALGYWLIDDTTAAEMTIGTDKDGHRLMKTWVLHEFLNSGSGVAALQRAAAYGQHPWHVVQLLLENEVPPARMTAAHYEALEWLNANKLLLDFSLASSAENFIEQIASAAGLCRKLNEQMIEGYKQRLAKGLDRGKPAKFDEVLWVGYAPFVERLKAAEPSSASIDGWLGDLTLAGVDGGVK